MSAILIYVTCGEEKEAMNIAKELLSCELAACANIIPQTKAIFKWEGVIQEQFETILILKSQKARLKEVIEKVKAIHSYDLPCILSIQIEDGNAKFLEWVLRNSERT